MDKELSENVNKIIESQKKIFKKVESIDICLKGDEYHPNGGLVNKVARNTKCISDVKKKQNRFFAVIGGAWTALTIGISIFIKGN
jgi:hypothetical protein